MKDSRFICAICGEQDPKEYLDGREGSLGPHGIICRLCAIGLELWDEHNEIEVSLNETQQEDIFCPACDAGAGHCNGPHKGSDEIEF